MLRWLAWRNVKILNQILHIWNLWVEGFQSVFELSKLVDILEALTQGKNIFAKDSHLSSRRDEPLRC